MKIKIVLFTLLLLTTVNSFSQKFYLGDALKPKATELKLIGISSSTGVYSYKYIGTITDKYFFNRKVGDIIVGIKNGIIVTTIYNLIPEAGDLGVPESILDLVQKNLPHPLAYRDGYYGTNIESISISLSRTTNEMTFKKDRIMFYTSTRNRYLIN